MANTRDDSLVVVVVEVLLPLWLPLGACAETLPLPTAAAVPLPAVGSGQDCFDRLFALSCLSGERYARSNWDPLSYPPPPPPPRGAPSSTANEEVGVAPVSPLGNP